MADCGKAGINRNGSVPTGECNPEFVAFAKGLMRLGKNEVSSVGGEILRSKLLGDPFAIEIRSRNVTARAFADNADDILLRARTSAQVQFALPLAGENARSYRSFSWMFPPPTFARANDKKSLSDTAFQHRDLAGSTSWDCGSTRKRPKVLHT